MEEHGDGMNSQLTVLQVCKHMKKFIKLKTKTYTFIVHNCMLQMMIWE